MIRLFRPAALAAAMLGLAACQDGTGPAKAPEFTVDVTASLGDTYLLTLDDGSPAVGCNFTFLFNPTGAQGATAAWAGGTLRFFAGAARTAPFDSLVLTAAEMDEQFGAGLQAGTRRSGGAGFLATVPYGMEAEFRYMVPGSNGSGAAKAYVPCLVSVPDAGTPPAVSGVQVTVLPGLPLEGGDRVRVTWTATSTTGLWETGVVLSGAFQARYRVGAAHQKNLGFSAEFVVPRNALLGQQLRVHPYALDLLVRESAAVTETVGPLTDVTAPVLVSTSPLRGSLEAGRDIGVEVVVQEAGRLAYLVYEAGPVGATVRDSVPLDTLGQQVVGLPTRAGWQGEGVIRLYVRDAAGNRSRTVESAPGTVFFYGERQVQVRETTLPYQPVDHAVDVARGRVAVAAWTQPRLFVYSLQSLGQMAAVDLSSPASQVDVAPDGRVVALLPRDNLLAVVDVAGQRVVSYVALNAAAVDRVYGFRITPAGRALVLARRSGTGASVVLEHDLTTGTQRVRTDAPVIPYPDAGVAASLDRSRLLLGAGCVYRADTDTFGACAPLWHGGGEYTGAPFSGSGTGTYWGDGSRVFDASLRQVRELGHSVLSADDRYAYDGRFGSILRVRLSDGAVEDVLRSLLYLDTRVSPDGALLVSLERSAMTGSAYHLRIVELP